MKKKVKLFSTIASLCLAVDLMAFGVMAATTETFKVASSVSYSVTGQVNAEFTVKVTYKTDGVDVTGGIGSIDKTEGNNTTKTWTGSRVPGQAASEISLTLGDYTFNEKSIINDTIVYEITIKNNSVTDKLSVELTNYLTSSKSDSQDAITLEVADSSFVTAVSDKKTASVDKLASITYKVTYKLSSPTKDASKQEFKPSFAVSVANEEA